MRVLILGATGFIGGQIARAARAEGFETHGLRRRPGSVGAIADVDITWHEGDLADPISLREAMTGCEVIYHAAAYYPYTDRDISAATRRAGAEIAGVLEAARSAGARRLVYTSSLTTIGAPPEGSGRLADERNGYVPGSARNAYYEAKWVMERAALDAAGAGLEIVALIPTAVFGPGDVKPATGQVLIDVARGRMPVGMHAETNFVDVREVGLAHVRAASAGTSGERYIIGGHNMDIAVALSTAAEVAGVRPPLFNLPRGFVTGLLGVVGGLPLPIPELARGLAHWQPMNAEKGQQAFGFEPRPFAETARDAVRWFRENGYI